MATDKRLDKVSTLTDFDYALIVKGDQVAKASKQQLAELVGNLLYGATNASSLASVVAGQIGVTQASTTINGITISTYNYGKIVTVILSGTATSNFEYVDVYNVGLVKTFKRMKYIINGTSGYVTTRLEGDYLNINGIKKGESIGSSVDGYISFTFVRS